jgi:hypothetical protein
MTKRIPIEFVIPPGALKVGEAANYLRVSRTKVWELMNLPKSNPKRLKKTSYGTIPIAECDRHLAEEVKGK